MTEKRFTDIEHDFENARIRCKDDGMFMLYAIYENDDGLPTLGDLLNEQEDANARLEEKNIELQERIKQQEQLISEQAIQLDYLKDENRHISEVLDENKRKEEEITFLKSTNMELEDANARLEEKNIELQERNDRQYDKLTHLWECIRNKDYETLQKELEEIEEADKKLQEEWKCYK